MSIYGCEERKKRKQTTIKWRSALIKDHLLRADQKTKIALVNFLEMPLFFDA